MSSAPGIRETPEGVEIDLKVVPGARRDTIAGLLGSRLKLRIASPAESGRANQAVRRIVSEALGISLGDVEILRGRTAPYKTVHVRGIDSNEVRSKVL